MAALVIAALAVTQANISDQTFNLGSGHGIAVGYVELVASKLMQGGKQIGHDGESFTVTRLGNGSADELVSSVEVLAHGQIDLSGLVTSTPSGPGTFQLAVTGGTETIRTPGPRHRRARQYPDGHHPPHPVTVNPTGPPPGLGHRAALGKRAHGSLQRDEDHGV